MTALASHLKRRRLAFQLALLFSFAFKFAQAQSDVLFDAYRDQFRGSGWTLGIGGHWLSPKPAESPALLPIVNESNSIDTLHLGQWQHQGSFGLRMGVGYWYVAKRPILWDRISIQLEGGKHRAESVFRGAVADSSGALVSDTLTDISAAGVLSELTLRLHRAIELKPDFFLECQMGLGWDAEWGGEFSRTGPEDSFVPRTAPSRHRVAMELGLGLGVRTRAGRFLRVVAQTDALQLQPLSNDGGGRIDRYEGAFRATHLTLQWDILRDKPDVSCAGSNLGSETMPLFEPKMQRKMKKRRRG